ncbi:hypothetical protein O6H91_21G072700 [Diphasiastrum complanatum]|uniref:Uncharacterized protein n=1 Tax=Diphasiastrum complanatum TaxID=34168 RepID=A0ACC2AN08_DIPCM|nr:hypothetical protein O6H91_21G072700 [Diphasiastrum complanatum]
MQIDDVVKIFAQLSINMIAVN